MVRNGNLQFFYISRLSWDILDHKRPKRTICLLQLMLYTIVN